MLLVNTIRRECFSATYQKGANLYLSDKIENRSIEEKDRESRIKADVIGSGRQRYKTSVTISDDDDIIEYSCTCPAYSSYFGMCKHCVALALSYRGYQLAKEKKGREQDLRPGKTGISKIAAPKADQKKVRPVTSSQLKTMISSYASMGKSRFMEGYGGEIQLIPEFDSFGQNMSVEFKIGSQRKYVLKNICKFLDCVEKGAYDSYGKSLGFVHTRDAFTEEALQWIDLLASLLRARYHNFSFSSQSYSSNFRKISLQSLGLEKCFQMYMGKVFQAGGKEYEIRDENPRLRLTVTAEGENGVRLKMDPIQAIYGSSRRYLVSGQTIYQCSPEFSVKVWPALLALNAVKPEGFSYHYGQEEALYLDKEDFRGFFGNVAPVLEPYLEIVTENFDPEQYRPREAELCVYLEYEEEAPCSIQARAEAVYGDAVYDIFEDMDLEKEYRDVEKERILTEELRKYFTFQKTKSGYLGYCPGEEELYDLLKNGLERLYKITSLMIDEKIRGIRLVKSPRVTVGVSLQEGMLDFSLESEDMSLAEMESILASLRRKKKFYRMKTGDFISLENNGLSLISDLSSGLQIPAGELEEGHFKAPGYRAAYVSEAVKEAGEGVNIRRSTEFRRLIRDMKSYSDSDFEIPNGINAKLRGYQKDGFRWLATLDAWGFGGILADDMGLGKTLQVIAFFQMKKENGLIVCPASLVYNWESELKRFAPELKPHIIAGAAKDRKVQIENMPEEKGGEIFITSYDLLKKDISFYKDKKIYCVIADEAQYLKNAGTQTAKAVKQLRAQRRFALTGTPIENQLSDLWSIFDFIMPGYLYGYSRFREELELPAVARKDEDALRRLKMLVTPFILRRKKKDVLKDLPDKLEEVVYTRMEEEQRKIYDAHVKRLRMELAGQSEEEYNQNKIKYLAELTRLRMICCCPALCFEGYNGGSAKTEMCMELIENAVSGGHCLLVFSQFTRMLDILSEELKKRKIEFLYLSGQNTKEERKSMVERFSSGEIPVFLISLKAGGTGLNLTAADMVIHYDPWWNKAAMDQASDRAHRIGQENVVTVMNLVVRDSVEEKIIALQQKKAEMADAVMDGSGISRHRLTREDLLKCLT